jgi:hypothetical protein
MAYQGTSSPADFKALQADLRAKARAGSFAHLSNGTLQIDWPYRSGGWSNSAPKTHADMLTLFGIPASAPFYPSLYKALNVTPGTPMPSHGWNVTTTHESGPSVANVLTNVTSAALSVYNAIPKPITAVLAPAALITDMAIQHPEMIPLFGKQAAQAKALFEGLKSGNMSVTDAANIAAHALAPIIPPGIANDVAAAAHLAASVSPLASQAMQLAQAAGQAVTPAAVPHPLALKLSPPPPAPPAVHAQLAELAAAGTHVPVYVAPAAPAPLPHGAPAAPPAAALHVSQAPGSPGAPKGATFWHCQPMPGGHWQCQWQ